MRRTSSATVRIHQNSLEKSIPERLQWKPMASTDLKIALIKYDSDIHARAAVDQKRIRQYAKQMRKGERFPPITVYSDGDTYWCADGYYRTEAARSIGRETILAEVKHGTRNDCIVEAASSNFGVDFVGLRRTKEDKRKIARMILQICFQNKDTPWSYSRIAEHCNLERHFVARQKLELDRENGVSGSSNVESRVVLSMRGKRVPVRSPGQRFPSLAERDEQIRRMFADGLGSGDISRRLCIPRPRVQEAKSRLGLVKRAGPLQSTFHQVTIFRNYCETTLEEMILEEAVLHGSEEDRKLLLKELRQSKSLTNKMITILRKSLKESAHQEDNPDVEV